MSVALRNNFFLNARALTFEDSASIAWTFDKNLNQLTATALSASAATSLAGGAPGSLPYQSAPSVTAMLTVGANGSFLGVTAGLPAWKTTIPVGVITGLSAVATSGAYSDLTGKPSIPVGANPSAKVGLTAVNGVAATWMSSDSAPSIDQAIVPTWTGTHTFTAAAVVQGDTALLAFKNTAAGNVFRVGTVKAWLGGGTNVTDTALGAFGALLVYVNDNGAPTLTIAATGAATLTSTFAINNGTPTAALSGFGSPSGTPTASLTNAATLAQTAGTLAALLAYLKTIGFIAA